MSGGHPEPPALQRMMGDVEEGRVSRIVVYRIDRPTRSHASKGGKRYRYYVSRRLVAGIGDDPGTGWRLQADRLERDLERAVREHLIECVERGDIVATDAGSIALLRSRAEALGGEGLELIKTVQLGDATLTINLASVEIGKVLAVTPDGIESTVPSFERPFTQRRRAAESRLTIGAPNAERDDILVANIAWADPWRVALCRGDELTTIAAHDGVTVKYLGEMPTFAFLSPKLARAILDVRQPSILTTNWLCRRGLPMSGSNRTAFLRNSGPHQHR